mmetsp:Transcript_30699/g.65350  ORF Transcript_30699/g.65350 Transcript_30699/m.65350 type:complete len:226 (-) Transcript_30699:393-1070(-)
MDDELREGGSCHLGVKEHLRHEDALAGELKAFVSIQRALDLDALDPEVVAFGQALPEAAAIRRRHVAVILLNIPTPRHMVAVDEVEALAQLSHHLLRQVTASEAGGATNGRRHLAIDHRQPNRLALPDVHHDAVVHAMCPQRRQRLRGDAHRPWPVLQLLLHLHCPAGRGKTASRALRCGPEGLPDQKRQVSGPAQGHELRSREAEASPRCTGQSLHGKSPREFD